MMEQGALATHDLSCLKCPVCKRTEHDVVAMESSPLTAVAGDQDAVMVTAGDVINALLVGDGAAANGVAAAPEVAASTDAPAPAAPEVDAPANAPAPAATEVDAAANAPAPGVPELAAAAEASTLAAPGVGAVAMAAAAEAEDFVAPEGVLALDSPSEREACTVKPRMAIYGTDFSDQPSVFCGTCNSPCELTMVRICSKRNASFRCKKCDCKITQLSRAYGCWPCEEFKSLSMEDGQAFFQELMRSGVSGSAGLKAKASELFARYHVQEQWFEEGGAFLPASVWDRKGFDAAAIVALAPHDDRLTHPILGECFRVKILSRGVRGYEGMRRESQITSRSTRKASRVLGPATPQLALPASAPPAVAPTLAAVKEGAEDDEGDEDDEDEEEVSPVDEAGDAGKGSKDDDSSSDSSSSSSSCSHGKKKKKRSAKDKEKAEKAKKDKQNKKKAKKEKRRKQKAQRKEKERAIEAKKKEAADKAEAKKAAKRSAAEVAKRVNLATAMATKIALAKQPLGQALTDTSAILVPSVTRDPLQAAYTELANFEATCLGISDGSRDASTPLPCNIEDTGAGNYQTTLKHNKLEKHLIEQLERAPRYMSLANQTTKGYAATRYNLNNIMVSTPSPGARRQTQARQEPLEPV